MASRGPLRRWKRFLPAFGAIDATIESALGCSRDECRRVTGDLVETLCECDAADAERADELCALLDQVMVEALKTLRLVAVTPTMLTSTDITRAVGDLRGHKSGMVGGLARTIFAEWRASIEDDVSRATAALEKLSQMPQEQHEAVGIHGGDRVSRVLGRADGVKQIVESTNSERPKKSGDRVSMAVGEDARQAVKITDSEHLKKIHYYGVSSTADHRVRGERTADAKRKHPEDYYREEADHVKRQRKFPVPGKIEQRPSKAHSAMRERISTSSRRRV
ncbi:hypothetical protein BS78_09G208400 [Paspalum vaginatum]|nr:hypothetical protein BS78_09G208400 [Paspalum vaginatum]